LLELLRRAQQPSCRKNCLLLTSSYPIASDVNVNVVDPNLLHSLSLSLVRALQMMMVKERITVLTYALIIGSKATA